MINKCKMSERREGDIMFILTEDDVLACANELGMSKEQVTDDVIELVKREVSLELGDWREVVKSALRVAIECPLGLVCYPSCYWWEDGKCTFPREDK